MLIPTLVYSIAVYTIISLVIDYRELKIESERTQNRVDRKLSEIISMIETKLGAK